MKSSFYIRFPLYPPSKGCKSNSTSPVHPQSPLQLRTEFYPIEYPLGKIPPAGTDWHFRVARLFDGLVGICIIYWCRYLSYLYNKIGNERSYEALADPSHIWGHIFNVFIYDDYLLSELEDGGLFGN